jgi:hypothetical protein
MKLMSRSLGEVIIYIFYGACEVKGYFFGMLQCNGFLKCFFIEIGNILKIILYIFA